MHGLCFDCIVSANEKSGDNESHLAGDNPQNGIHCTWWPTYQKQKTGRTIPSHLPIVDFLRSFPRPIHSGYIFGQSKRLNRNAYNKAVEVAGITDLHFSGSS